MVDLDVIWVVACAGLVLLMQPGFMCLESGLTRSKNSINVAIKNLVDLGISICFFWIFGFALMFGASQMGWVGTSGFFLPVESDPSLAAFFIFQAMFAGTSTTIVSGALAERLKFTGYAAIAMLSSSVVYPLIGHWVWNGINTGELTGWLGRLGFIDFAGASVVHSVGGWVSLAALLVVGPRTGRFVPRPDENGQRRRPEVRRIHGSNLPFSVLGVMLLWVGWLGFNGGSTFALTNQVPAIIVHTILSGAVGMLSAGAFDIWRRKRLRPEALINGSLAGMVAITASCNVVTTPIAMLIGATGGLIMLAAAELIERCGIDDGVDAVALHGFTGVWGTLSVAFFGDLELIGTGLSRHEQLLAQLLGVSVTFAWAFGFTYLVLRNLNRIFPLRVSIEEEEIGLNVSEHDAKTEVYELFRVMDEQASTQNFSLRVPEEPFTEAGKIARRYNDVMDSLEGYAHRLNTLNSQLEQTVAVRTAELREANQQLATANQELKRLDQLKDEFLANTSHELRTPLNGIIGLSDYLIESTGDQIPQAALVNLAMIASSGRRLYSLVSEILDFSKILHGNPNLQMQAVELRSVAEVVLTLCRPLTQGKDVQLVNAIDENLPLAFADESRLQQILYNLVGNAIKFTDQGWIEISAQMNTNPASSMLTLEVADTGIGIPADKIDRIFEPFEQAEGSSDREYGGLGLGLSVTQKLVEFHNGTIWVDSAVGRGTRFYFTLPVYSSEADERSADQPTDQPTDQSTDLPNTINPSTADLANNRSAQTIPLFEDTLAEGRDRTPFFQPTQLVQKSAIALLANTLSETGTQETGIQKAGSQNDQTQPASFEVLIVDDDPINLQVLNNYLGLCNYEITQASSGQEALTLLSQGYHPDLVILDVMMPKMTGYEVTRAIRAKWKRDELPIVLLTAKDRLDDEVVGLQAGANDYLTKPIVKEGLIARIRTQLSLRQESKDRQQAQFENVRVAQELKETNLALLSVQSALAQQNRTLEQQVAERTAVLEESQRTLATLMKNLPGMAYRCMNDPGWTMLFVSEGCFELTGYYPEDFVTHRSVMWGNLVHPEDRGYNWQDVQNGISQRRSFQTVYRLLLPESGQIKWIWEQGQGIWDTEGNLKFVEGFMTDISDRILFEKKLKRSNQDLQNVIQTLEETQAQLKVAKEKSEAANSAKSDFLASMSHELRTPLNSIIGFAQLLNRDTALQSQQQQRANIIYRSAENLLSLINNILDISKIEAGKITLTKTHFDLHSLLNDVLNLFEPTVQQKQIELILEIDSAVSQFVYTDEGKLRQILTNLIANAIKFTEQGQVRLCVRVESVDSSVDNESVDDGSVDDGSVNSRSVESNWVESGSGESEPRDVEPNLDHTQAPLPQQLYFSIQDTGVGIASDELDRLFMPFEQASAGRAIRQGTGLGLSISRKYTQLMGGDMSVSSTLGQGSLFEFRIPIDRSSSAAQQQACSKTKVVGIAASQPEYRILIVDDLPDNLQLLTELLESVGFVIEQATNGQEAVDLWHSWRPHLICMDLLMPVMDGYEAMRQIRARQAAVATQIAGSKQAEQSELPRPKTIIVAVTASVLKESKAEIIALGFDDCVFKPFKESVIWSMLSQHLGIEFIYKERPAGEANDFDDVFSEEIEAAVAHSQKLVRLSVESLAEALRGMPADWRHDLYQAANRLEGRRVFQLIDQIPPEQDSLAHSLQDIAEHYQFDTIVAILDTL